ncbi:hypothetical protein GCM10009122_58560 [Fulvivirga kasyanovii]
MFFQSYGQLWPTGIHDPSSIIKCKDKYWIFGTGNGISSKYSTDLVTWTDGPSAFQNGAFPDWILKYAKNPNNTDKFEGHFWAPDIIHMNGKYYLYYSASVWGTTYSCIGVVVNKTLDPQDPEYKWVDQGDIGIHSPKWGWNINAIDPAMMKSPDGRVWMTYGSFNKDGIMVTEIDTVSGAPKGTTVSVANSWTGGYSYGEGEGAHTLYHDGYYYLFYNKGGCCSGIASSYYIVMGRSTSPQGPFVDKSGKQMRLENEASGGTIVFKHDDSRGLEDRYYGPGHLGSFRENGVDYVTFHYYEPNGPFPNEEANNMGSPTLGLAKLEWGEDGWPSISMDFLKEGVYTLTNAHSNKVLGLEGNSTNAGTIAYQYTKDDTQATQRWYFKPLGTGEYTIQSFADTSKYLEVAAPDYNSKIQLASKYTGAINQKWRLVKDVHGKLIIYPSTKDVIMEIPYAYTQDYAVKLWSNSNHACQRWTADLVGTVDAPASVDLQASGADGAVNLSWTLNNISSDVIQVLRDTDPTPSGRVRIAYVTSGSTFTDTNVTNGTTYYYWIKVTDTTGKLTESTVVSATPAGAASLVKGGTGSSSQTINLKESIADFNFKWTNASTVKVNGVPMGINVTIDNATQNVSFSGTPTETGVFNYSISTVGGNPDNTHTATITVNNPVHLQASGSNGAVNLSWTLNNISSNVIQVLRDTDPTPSGRVRIAYVTSGSTFTDTNVTNGTTYYYWIKVTDTTGKLTESGIASATPVSNQSARINSTSTANAFGDTPEAPSLLESENIGWSVFPNPVKNTLEIKGEFSGNWILYDMQNREVMSGNQTSLQMEDMKQGMYILKIEGKAIRIIKE